MDNKSHENDDALLEAEESQEAKADKGTQDSSAEKNEKVTPALPEEDSNPENSSDEQNTVQSQPGAAVMRDDETADKKDRKKTSKGKWIVALACVAAVITLAVFFFCTHAVLGSLFGRHEIFYRDTPEINLSGSDYEDYSQLSKVKSLKVIDLTNSSFSDLSDLSGCKKLQRVILTGKEFAAQDCLDFFSNAPQASLVCKIKIYEQSYDSDITELKADTVNEKTQRLFAALTRLEYLDLTACEVKDDTYRYLSDALPNCKIIIRTEICSTEYQTDADSVVLNGELTDRDVERIGYFANLKLIDRKYCTNPDKLTDFLSANPDIIVNQPVELLGKIVGTEDEVADLRGTKYTLTQVKEALDEKLPELKSLKKIDMCGCGLTNREMEQLCKAYPDIKFVWMVHFKRWSVRTDAVVFSTLNGNGYEFYDQNDYAPVFKYCTDLIALDLGHSLIYDISPIASMKKLRAVILTDNKIRNISAFAKLKDLEFIEMNVNRVQSAEPLRGLKKLKYIDFWSSSEMTNLEPLYDHPELRIAILHRTVSQAERKRFMKSNPDCDAYFRVDTVKTTTNRAWRKNPYRKKLKVAFKNWKNVVGFDEKTGKYIFDYDTDQYSIM